MWMFRGSNDDDSDFESDDYDSDEYETGSEEELDSNDDDDDDDEPAVNKKRQHQHADSDMPERVETEDGLSEEEEVKEEDDAHNEQYDVLEEEEQPSKSQEGHHENGTDQDPKDENAVLQPDESREKSVDIDQDSSEEEDATSLAEKRALLALAAENDRVDILKAILTDEDRHVLLHSELPPLHIAISYGSTNATSCLLRMGANPAIRPTNCSDKRYGNTSAWELAFGSQDHSIKPVDMPPSKREGIRHAFTAEALRCIGSDESERLQHLLDGGMPPSIDIGAGKNLYGWSVEMGATKCKELTQPFEPQQEKTESGKEKEDPKPSAVVSYHDSDSLLSLDNRLEELDSLSKALSSCLDNLAEEVSVCHGLLLLGGGASALASHVRSLKVLKERRETELERCLLEWNDSQDELAYWLLQNGGDDGFDDTSIAGDSEHTDRKRSFQPPENTEDEEVQRRQLKAQIAASENKVRKLRTSIADLSEENARDLVEVEKRGLSGGIKLVRTLREELREVEFQLSEAKSGTAASRARVNLIVSRLEADKKKASKAPTARDSLPSPTPNDVGASNGKAQERVSSLFADEDPSESERIASGDSEALAVRAPGNQGYLPIDLWDIIMRIIGLGRVAVKKSVRENTPTAMII